MTTDVRAAAKHLLALRKAQEGFRGFVKLHHPEWDLPPFHEDLIERLDAFEKDSLGVNNLLITMPPRHSKSTYSTVLFPSYYMARDPRRFVMSCSYNGDLATGFGREVRTIVEDALTQQAFPDFQLDKRFHAADSWRTEAGGLYNAVGIGGTTSGRPANLLNVDDPIKAREDAESMNQRNKTWNYYTSALATRLQPTHDGRPAKQLIVLTRWHPDDLGGRVMETDDWAEGLWEHINYRAIDIERVTTSVLRSALPKDHPLFVGLGEPLKGPPRVEITEEVEKPLWPSRFPLADLKRRQRLNPHDFASLYQQEPFIKGGNLIKTSWWRNYPSDFIPTLASLIIVVDTAFKKTENADYSVAMTGGMDANGDLYVIDVHRRKSDYPDLKRDLITLNNRWRGRGLRGLYIEDKASGQSIIQDLKRGTGMAVIPYPVRGDKVTRLQSVLPLIEGGRVFLPESAPWLDAFIEECVSFPNSRHDDQVDALTMLLDILSRTTLSPEVLSQHVDVGQSLNAMASDWDRIEAASNPNPVPTDAELARNNRQTGTLNRQSPFGKSLNQAIRSAKWGGWGI